MLDWWLAPLSGATGHAIAVPVAWHARLMVLAWGVLIPVGVLWARFWKVAPGQDWPRELDDKRWWHAHRTLQIGGFLLGLAALALVFRVGATTPGAEAHHLVGWIVVAAGAWQVAHGFARGSKGGPTAPTLAGDHYDMTPRRVLFERVHKSLGWVVVVAAVAAIASGLLVADAPRWMAAAIAAWWLLLAARFVRWQRAGRALDTYQAIWGPDPALPGNARAPIGWGVTRQGAGWMNDGGKR
jgi:hypothetical protein